jgi:ElaB/YqjD/DUF883 family membrane-anchored ribosome-binding protein
MDNRSKNKPDISEEANDLLKHGKKFAGRLYDEGMDKVGEASDEIHEYSDELVKKIRRNPLTSLVIAAGVGFLISSLMKK